MMQKYTKLSRACYIIAIIFAIIAIVFKNNIYALIIGLIVAVIFVILYALIKVKIHKLEEEKKDNKIDDYEKNFALRLEGKKNQSEAYKLMYIVFNNQNKEISSLISSLKLQRLVEIEYNEDLKLFLDSPVDSYKDRKNKYSLTIKKDKIYFNSNNLDIPLTKNNDYDISKLKVLDLVNYLIEDLKLYAKK